MATIHPYTHILHISFESAAPHLWNNLPNGIRGIQMHETFKKSIKTYLFKSAYDLT